MSLAELKMQPTIHLECKAGYGRGIYPDLPSQCIVGCIFSSVRLNIIHTDNFLTTEYLNVKFSMDLPTQID
jgi:hypothetical protein